MVEAVDRVTLKIVTANTTDVTLRTEEDFKDKVVQPGPSSISCLAEHGLAILVRIDDGDRVNQYLYDMGGLNATIINNLKVLKINPQEFNRVIISHGHYDHWGGIIPLLSLLTPKTEFLFNAEVFFPRYFVSKELLGTEIAPADIDRLKKEQKLRELPKFPEKKVRRLALENNIKFNYVNEAMKIAPGVFLSGKIEIDDEAELTKGLLILKEGKMMDDTFSDELALYINVKDKGLIVLTGCGHAGIINTIKYGQKITGISQIYAIIGGFHQNWNTMEQIRSTIKILKTLNPELICGLHCTGFKFLAEAMQQMPLKTALAVVGTTIHL